MSKQKNNPYTTIDVEGSDLGIESLPINIPVTSGMDIIESVELKQEEVIIRPSITIPIKVEAKTIGGAPYCAKRNVEVLKKEIQEVLDDIPESPDIYKARPNKPIRN